MQINIKSYVIYVNKKPVLSHISKLARGTLLSFLIPDSDFKFLLYTIFCSMLVSTLSTLNLLQPIQALNSASLNKYKLPPVCLLVKHLIHNIFFCSIQGTRPGLELKINWHDPTPYNKRGFMQGKDKIVIFLCSSHALFLHSLYLF